MASTTCTSEKSVYFNIYLSPKEKKIFYSKTHRKNYPKVCERVGMRTFLSQLISFRNAIEFLYHDKLTFEVLSQTRRKPQLIHIACNYLLIFGLQI